MAKAVRALRGGEASTILRLDYKRNTVDVNDAVARLRQYKAPIKAVVMVPTYRAAANLLRKDARPLRGNDLHQRLLRNP